MLFVFSDQKKSTKGLKIVFFTTRKQTRFCLMFLKREFLTVYVTLVDPLMVSRNVCSGHNKNTAFCQGLIKCGTYHMAPCFSENQLFPQTCAIPSHAPHYFGEKVTFNKSIRLVNGNLLQWNFFPLSIENNFAFRLL